MCFFFTNCPYINVVVDDSCLFVTGSWNETIGKKETSNRSIIWLVVQLFIVISHTHIILSSPPSLPPSLSCWLITEWTVALTKFMQEVVWRIANESSHRHDSISSNKQTVSIAVLQHYFYYYYFIIIIFSLLMIIL